MKKLFSIAAPAALLAAMVATPATAGNTHLSGFIDEVCEVTIVDNDLWLSSNVVAGAMISSPVNFECNDADGATVTMTSSEGGLESDDQEDLEVEYVATLTAGAFSLVLDTGPAQGNNDESVSGQLAASGAATAGSLDIVLTDGAPWAGGYSDTIAIDITAN